MASINQRENTEWIILSVHINPGLDISVHILMVFKYKYPLFLSLYSSLFNHLSSSLFLCSSADEFLCQD